MLQFIKMQHSGLLVTFALTLCLLLTVAAGPYPDGFDETFCTPAPNDGGWCYTLP